MEPSKKDPPPSFFKGRQKFKGIKLHLTHAVIQALIQKRGLKNQGLAQDVEGKDTILQLVQQRYFF